MFERRKLTLKENILLVLGSALVFSIIFTVVGPLASHQTSDKIAAFAADGATTTGKVTGKRMEMVMVSKVMTWWLQVEFKTEKGDDRLDSLLVANSIYDRYDVGDPIRVTYVKSNPGWFYIPGAEPTARDVAITDGMSKYGRLAAGASLIGILVVLFAGRGGRAPTGRATKTAAPAPNPPPQGPRAEFGARRRA